MIEVQGLTKYYGDTCAIKNVSFKIDQGQIVGILGLNGAGKTTTLRILSCLLLPSTGKVTINDLDIYENPHEIRKQVGFLPEEPPLYREMTVDSYLTFAAELRGLSRSDARSRVGEVLEITPTEDVAHQVIANLSHGYRKRVGIAQSIVHQPPVLILDEPISGLDPVQIVNMRETIRGLKERHTILVSSHILPEISQTCDHILVIEQGRIVAAGTEEELISGSSGAQRLHLAVRGDHVKMVDHIRGIDGVTSCRLKGQNNGGKEPYRSTPENIHHLTVEAASDVRETLSRELVQAGFGLLQISPAETELESVLIQLTQHKEVEP
jgi:ABC-2 type transport system ATP-binding protein